MGMGSPAPDRAAVLWPVSDGQRVCGYGDTATRRVGELSEVWGRGHG